LIVPLVLAVSVAGALAAALSSTVGCPSDKAQGDARSGDGPPGDPIG